MADVISGAIIGYGTAFNMGKAHAHMMQRTEGIECVAICDMAPVRTKAAESDFPGVSIYNRVEELLVDKNVEIVANILPYNLQCAVTVQGLAAGKHVIVEKPMCVTIVEANGMINTTKANDLMLSVHHNRR